MNIDVVLNPAEIATLSERDLSQVTCVVFDVLRATSSIVTALAHGAHTIVPARTIEEALALKLDRPDAALGGERHGEKIDGFDLGNSPFEYRDLETRAVIMTTTNGTIALRACEKAGRVLVGAVLNIGALASELRGSVPDAVLLVCAGTFWEFALEDACAAGLLIADLMDGAVLSDSACAALAVARAFPEPLDCLRQARNGRVLESKGRGIEVEWCGQVSKFSTIGELVGGAIVPMVPATVPQTLVPELA